MEIIRHTDKDSVTVDGETYYPIMHDKDVYTAEELIESLVESQAPDSGVIHFVENEQLHGAVYVPKEKGMMMEAEDQTEEGDVETNPEPSPEGEPNSPPGSCHVMSEDIETLLRWITKDRREDGRSIPDREARDVACRLGVAAGIRREHTESRWSRRRR